MGESCGGTTRGGGLAELKFLFITTIWLKVYPVVVLSC